jgi:hypothetical protein
MFALCGATPGEVAAGKIHGVALSAGSATQVEFFVNKTSELTVIKGILAFANFFNKVKLHSWSAL